MTKQGLVEAVADEIFDKPDFEPIRNHILTRREFRRLAQPIIQAAIDKSRATLPSAGDGKDGAALITTERQRQIMAEGWMPEHDDLHVRCEMAQAAACYAYAAAFGHRGNLTWPWALKWWKPGPFTKISARIRALVKAGALIAAEIDRMQRQADKQLPAPPPSPPPPQPAAEGEKQFNICAAADWFPVIEKHHFDLKHLATVVTCHCRAALAALTSARIEELERTAGHLTQLLSIAQAREADLTAALINASDKLAEFYGDEGRSFGETPLAEQIQKALALKPASAPTATKEEK